MAYFLLKARQYRWSIVSLCAALMVSLIVNITLISRILTTNTITIFVPTSSSESFVFDGSFSPTYFERMAMFLSQRLLSFHEHTNLESDLSIFGEPTQKNRLLSELTLLASTYKQNDIQCFFTPIMVTAHTKNKVCIQGEHRFFIKDKFLQKKPITVTLSFKIIHGKCLLSHIALQKTRSIDKP
ncbi:MAG: TraE/TraK family type IV conjugative transfer system protein [Alphaproteobacteria bacterium]|nr:TraE/TraK family type IV conjugative transfer system protein [Alphaproteobacteria bacterium]